MPSLTPDLPLAFRRLGAAAIDGALALLVAFVIALPGSGPFKAHLFGFGLLLASAFVLLRDTLPSLFSQFGSRLINRSPGKAAMSLRVWPGRDERLSLTGSLKRNLPLAAPLLVWGLTRAMSGYMGIPFWNWILTLTLILVFAEAVLLFIASGPAAPQAGERRLGDLWAGTQVYEG